MGGAAERLVMCKTKKLAPYAIIHDMRIKMPHEAVSFFLLSFPPVPTLIQKSITLLWSHLAALSVLMIQPSSLQIDSDN